MILTGYKFMVFKITVVITPAKWRISQIKWIIQLLVLKFQNHVMLFKASRWGRVKMGLTGIPGPR
jgi:choline-glycine betaine transporter